MSLPQSTTDKIKKALLHVLQLPSEIAHVVDVDVRKFGHEVKIVLIAAKNDIEKFEDLFKRHDRFEADAVSSNDQHEYIFSSPSIVKSELNELATIDSHEDGVIGKQQAIERLASEITDKYYKDAIDDET